MPIKPSVIMAPRCRRYRLHLHKTPFSGHKDCSDSRRNSYIPGPPYPRKDSLSSSWYFKLHAQIYPFSRRFCQMPCHNLVSGGHLRLPLCTLTCLSKYTTRIRVHRGRHFSPPDTRVNDRKPPSPIALCDPVRGNGLGGFLSFICQIILLL